MKIAVAQIGVIKGDVSLNVGNHLKYIKEASELGVDYLVFPELSLTGYEPELAKELSFESNDSRLTPLIEAAIEYKLSIGVGAPMRSLGLPKIGLFVIHQTGKIESIKKCRYIKEKRSFLLRGRDITTSQQME